MTDETSYGLVLSFSGLYENMPEEHAFVHGVEFGGLWARMKSGDEAEIDATAHLANKTVIERAAVSQGWDLECLDAGDGCWMTIKLTKVRSERTNPHGLRVVN